MGESRIRRSVLALIITAAATTAACDPVATTEDVADPTAPTGNVADQMIRIAVEAAAIQQPFEVVEVRQGPIDELIGLSTEAEAQASVTVYATDRHSLVRRAWRVRIIGTSCTGEPCVASRFFIETIIDAQNEHIIAVKTSPVPSDLSTPAP